MRDRPSPRRSTACLALVSAFSLGLVACGSSTSPSVVEGSGGNGGSSSAGASGGGAGGTASLGGSSGAGGGVAGATGGAGAGGAAGSVGAGGRGGSAGGGGSAGAAGNVGAGGHGGSTGGGGAGGVSGLGGAGGHGGAAGVSGGGGTGGQGAFVCSLLIGNSTTQQWFDGGFLTYPGIDPTHWELYWVAHHYLDSWANPADTGWTTPLDMGHACASDSTTPDRVIFIATFAPPYPAEATYQTDLTSIVNNIKAKYSTVKRIELMTLIRSPGNSDTACSSKANNEQSIPPAEDDGIAAVAADPAFSGLVFALPPAYVSSCSDFLTDEPQYTAAGATDIAQVYGAYYAAHP